MNRDADDVSRMFDRLMKRVDRLENEGEEETEVGIAEAASETVEVEDELRETFLDIEDWQWGDTQWGAGQWQNPNDND